MKVDDLLCNDKRYGEHISDVIESVLRETRQDYEWQLASLRNKLACAGEELNITRRECAIAERLLLNAEEEKMEYLRVAIQLGQALEYAVKKYGKEGGPWNVPSDPGGWIDRANMALGQYYGLVKGN